jgi:hypothetical protein
MPGIDEQAADAAPFKQVAAFGRQVPYYVIRFDKDGTLQSPEAVASLFATITADGITDILFYSHGWNNDFPVATSLYDHFVGGVSEMAASHDMLPDTFNPVFVGIIWPSTALTFGSENAPVIAGGVAEAEAADLVATLPAAVQGQAAAILDATRVSPDNAALLAVWVAETIAGDTDAEIAAGRPAPADILASWQNPPPPLPGTAGDNPSVDGFTDFGIAKPAGDDPQAAALTDYFDPRWMVRVATVLIMKDRAGVVGAHGVSDLVRRLLRETQARLFLFGHSYGAKVVMTALAVISAGTPRRRVEGVLLLQPAVSYLCFADDIGDGSEGGYVRTLPLVSQPIHLTWSRQDVPLTRLFHLAARRALDLGEMQFAGPPSRYAALGGYGAQECATGTCADLDLPAPGTWHGVLAPGVRIVSLNGSATITGHGDVNRPETFCAAASLMR